MTEDPPPIADLSRVSRRRPEWMPQLVLPVAVAVLAALLIAIFTPFGEWTRELLFPTRSAVSGSVLLDGQPGPNVGVKLDGEDAVNTGADGRFLLVSVGNGEHRLHLETVGAKPRDWEFTVDSGETKMDLGAIEMKPLVRLGYAATVGPPRFTDRSNPSSLAAEVDYDVTLWIRGDPAVMRRIKSVSYTLPAPLPTVPVAGATGQQAFCYRQAGALSFQELFVSGGAFATAAAVVDLGDGESFQISAQPGESRPPNCPAHRGKPPSQSTGQPPWQLPDQPPPGRVRFPSPDLPQLPVPMVKVTNVIGETREAAKAELEKNFGVKVECPYSAKVGPNADPVIVLDQSPKSGRSPKGSTVTIFVPPVTVTNVIGEPREAAIERLMDDGFNVEVTYRDDPKHTDSGSVLDQDPKGDVKECGGSTVTIVVSRLPS